MLTIGDIEALEAVEMEWNGIQIMEIEMEKMG
jgi:hypothetical protein